MFQIQIASIPEHVRRKHRSVAIVVPIYEQVSLLAGPGLHRLGKIVFIVCFPFGWGFVMVGPRKVSFCRGSDENDFRFVRKHQIRKEGSM